MTKQTTFLSLLLLTAACSQEPPAKADRPVMVVAGVASAKAPEPPVVMPAIAPTATPDTARVEPKLLSVAESAEIHTSEMWSEPIALTR